MSTTTRKHVGHLGDCCSNDRMANARILSQAAFGSVRQSLVQPIHRGLVPGSRAAQWYADMLVLGSIATANPGAPTAEAMAVKDGMIVGIGSKGDVEGLVGPDTQIVSQSDGVITPGLVEPHMHLWGTVLADRWLNCSQLENPTFDDVVKRIKDAAAKTPDGDWVQGQLFDPSLFPGEPDLTVEILDKISTTKPIAILNASFHYLYVNSKAFELAGITADTPDPEGGKFYRENGALTGVVGESSAILKFLAVQPERTQADLVDGLRDIMKKAASVGITTMREAFTGAILGTAEISLLHQMNAAQRLPVRISTAQSSTLGVTAWQEAGVAPMSGDDMVRAVAWKIISDGSNQGRSGYMRDPYVGQPDNYGEANFPESGIVDLIKAGHGAGWQIMLHANGDAAMDLCVDAFEEVLSSSPDTKDLRHRIEHCSLAHADHLQRMAKIGVSPSFLMNHVYYWGRAMRDNILGPERAEHLDAMATAVASGLRPSLHSDYSVSPMEPLVSARTAVQRKMRDGGEVLNPSECVPPDVALKAVTTDAAWQVHADKAGSLQVGNQADWAVLSDNPWTADPDSWGDIKTHETRIGGEVAWSE